MAKTEWNWDKHKYKSKEWVNGAWKYIYNTAKNTTDKAKETAKEISSKVSNARDTAAKSKEYITSKLNNSKEINSIKNTIEKNVKELDKVRQKTEKKIKDQYSNLFNSTPKEILASSDKESIIVETVENRYPLTATQMEALNNKIRDIVIEDEIWYYQEDNFLREFNESLSNIPIVASVLTGTWPAYLLGMYLLDKHLEPINKEYRDKAIEESYLENQNKVDDAVEEEVQKIIEANRAQAERDREEYERRKRREDALKDIKHFLDNLPFDYDKVDYYAGPTHVEYDLRNLIEEAFLDSTETYATESISDRDELQDKVNPNYDPNDADVNYERNCASCSLTFELLNRGYSYADAKHLNGGATDDTIFGWYKDPKVVDFTNITKDHLYYSEQDIYNMEDTLSAIYPDGAYGQVGISWNPYLGYAGGHSMIFEKVDGEIILRDTQSNEIYYSNRSSNYNPPSYNFWGSKISGDDYSIETYLMRTSQIYFFRSDNLELNTTNINSFYLDDDNPWRLI